MNIPSNAEIAHRLNEHLSEILEEHVAPIFKPDVLLTLIARKPDNPESDVMHTRDTTQGLASLLLRMQEREQADIPFPCKHQWLPGKDADSDKFECLNCGAKGRIVEVLL